MVEESEHSSVWLDPTDCKWDFPLSVGFLIFAGIYDRLARTSVDFPFDFDTSRRLRQWALNEIKGSTDHTDSDDELDERMNRCTLSKPIAASHPQKI